MKKLLLVLLTLLMLVSIAGCGTPAKTGESAKPSTASTPTVAPKAAVKRIGVLYCLLSAPAVKVFAQGIEGKAKELGVELVELDGEWNAQKQTDQMNSLISQKVDAIILNPVDSKSLIPIVKKAKEAGISVVMGAMDIAPEGKQYVVSFVGADEKDVGRSAGELMKKALGEAGGNVAIVEGQAGTDPQINRTAGFEEAVSGSNIKVAAKLPGEFDKAKAMVVTQDALTKYKDLKGIFVQDDTMCVGVVQAMKAMGLTGKDIKIVSYNGSKAGADMVKAGAIAGTSVQPLAWEGATALQAAIDASNGKAVEKWYKDKIEPITKDNVDSYDPKLLW